ncbi:hypothetical protein BH09PAT2_BH09PAT2_04280 [soil metagenome]
MSESPVVSHLTRNLLLFLFIGLSLFFGVTTVAVHIRNMQIKNTMQVLKVSLDTKMAIPTSEQDKNDHYFSEEYTAPSKNYIIKLEYDLGLTKSSICEAKANLFKADGTGPLAYTYNDGWRGDYLFSCPEQKTYKIFSDNYPTFSGFAKGTDTFFLETHESSSEAQQILYAFNQNKIWHIKGFDITGKIALTSSDLSFIISEEKTTKIDEKTTLQLHLYDNTGKEYEKISVQTIYPPAYTHISGLNAAIALLPTARSAENSDIQTVQAYLIDFDQKKIRLLGDDTRTLLPGPSCESLKASFTSKRQIELSGECLDSATSFPY